MAMGSHREAVGSQKKVSPLVLQWRKLFLPFLYKWMLDELPYPKRPEANRNSEASDSIVDWNVFERALLEWKEDSVCEEGL